MDLPGLPPVDLKLSGQGPMSNFAARLDFSAGPTIGAAGTATVRRATSAYDVNVDLASRIEGLLPAPAAPIFSGTTQLVGNVTVGDDSSLRFQPVRITSNVARFDMTGTVSSGQVLDLKLNARALPTDGTKTRAGEAEIARLNFDGTVQGPLTAPRVNGTLDAAEVRLPQGSLDALRARVAMNPVAGVTPPDRFSFDDRRQCQRDQARRSGARPGARHDAVRHIPRFLRSRGHRQRRDGAHRDLHRAGGFHREGSAAPSSTGR